MRFNAITTTSVLKQCNNITKRLLKFPISLTLRH